MTEQEIEQLAENFVKSIGTNYPFLGDAKPYVQMIKSQIRHSFIEGYKSALQSVGGEAIPVKEVDVDKAIGIIEDLIEYIPKQDNDHDWWPDELTNAVEAAKKYIEQIKKQGEDIAEKFELGYIKAFSKWFKEYSSKNKKYLEHIEQQPIKEGENTPKPFTGEMWCFLLANSLRCLTEEQRAGLCFDLYGRSIIRESIDSRIKELRKPSEEGEDKAAHAIVFAEWIELEGYRIKGMDDEQRRKLYFMFKNGLGERVGVSL